jgi:hypothetical protein
MHSKFIGVCKATAHRDTKYEKTYWLATMRSKGRRKARTFKTEREAARQYDKWRRKHRLPMVNVLIDPTLFDEEAGNKR